MQANVILKPRDEWNVIDASKLTDYMSCPRRYFFRSLLGWIPIMPNNHLTFGTAWHMALEHLLLHNYSKESLTEATHIFEDRYRRDFGVETDGLYGAKSPYNAMLGLIEYYNRFKTDVDNYDTLYTEVGGKVKLGDNAVLAFRIDCIRRDRHTGQIEVLDHKSSQRRMAGWDRIWSLSVQLLSYIHVLYSLWDIDKIKGGRVRATFFYKKEIKFEEARVRKTPADMESFLVDVLTYYDMLRKDTYLLMETCNDSDLAMAAFPRNQNGCYHYGRLCEYFDVCEAWSNPLQHCDETPEGYRIEFWDPLSDERIRNEVDLSQ